MKKKYIGILTVIVAGILAYITYFKTDTNQEEPLVSVVMPTYNRADFLPRSIESILDQDYHNFEFIIVDDGSTDTTADVLASYQAKDKRIRILKNPENRGISFSRNRGTDAAKGKYVAVMDSDDYSEPNRLSVSVAFLEEHPDIVGVNSLYYEMNNEKKGLNNWVPPKRFEIIFNLKNYFNNIAVFRTDFVRQHNIRYDETMISSEDYDFWKKIFINGGKLAMINEQLVKLRRHHTNSENYYKDIIINSHKSSNELLARFDIFPDDSTERDECDLMRQMLEKNKEKHIVDQYVMEITYDRACAHSEKLPHGTFYVKHFDFVDYFIPTGTRRTYKRRQTGEEYVLVHNYQRSYIFKKQDGTVEEYYRQKDASLGYKGKVDQWRYIKSVIADFFANKGRKKLRNYN